MDKFLKTCLSPTSDDNYLSKNDASTQVLYLNKRILSDFFFNENCWVTEEEKEILKIYCEQTGRAQSDVLREFVRSLQKKMLRHAKGSS